MSAESIFERNRPRVLDEIVGNERAKRILTGMLYRNDYPNGVMLSGPKGCGKTSIARVLQRTFACEERCPGTVAPCLTCDSCIDVERVKRTNITGVVVITRNCSDLTLDHVHEDFGTARWAHEMIVIYYDEFQRTTERLENLLVTYLEDPTFTNLFFILSTPEPQKVDEALRQRLLRVQLQPPTAQQVCDLLDRICIREEIQVADHQVLAELTEQSQNIPREAINLLQQLTYETPIGAPLTIGVAQEMMGTVTSVDDDLDYLDDSDKSPAFDEGLDAFLAGSSPKKGR